MSDGVIYTLHYLLGIIGHWALGMEKRQGRQGRGGDLRETCSIKFSLVPKSPLPLFSPLLHLPISPFLHRAIALKYAAIGI